MPNPKRARQSGGPVNAPPPPAAFTRAYEAQLVRGVAELQLIECGDGVLADRHDILHLLPSLPRPSPPQSPSSYSSWSLPSDAEDTFALSGDELEAHAAQRRRGWVEGLRAARLAEREREDAEQERERERKEDMVANEPPTPEVLRLMEHTAKALAASPNPAALETRIVTRQAGDPRFAFLRPGAPSSAVWARVRAAAMPAVEPVGSTQGRAPAETKPGLGGLGGYDSDSDSESETPPAPPPPGESPPPPPPDTTPPPSPPPP